MQCGCFIMRPIKTFGIIGGDRRQVYLARSLKSDGYNVLPAGFGKLKKQGFEGAVGVDSALLYSDAVLLPLPSVRADKSVNAPFADESIFFDENRLRLLCKKPVFAAMRDRLLRAYPQLRDAQIFDYAAREDFAIRNALPTAEGALETALREYEGTVFQSRSLVTGFGRIGKQLAKMLSALGSEVTVCARRATDLAFAESLGFNALDIHRLKEVRGFDLVFNTVPAMLFDEALLQSTDKSTLLIDLASLPGGVDFESARALGLSALRALSLPGKCAPKAAGEIIKKTVISIIEEGNR